MSAVDDDVQIRAVLGRAVLLADEGSPDDYGLVYTADAIWTSGGSTQTGLDEIVAATRERRKEGRTGPGSAARHVTVPLQIEVDGDTAGALSYFILISNVNTEPVIKRFAVYDDQLRRTPNGWRLSRRIIRAG